ncbi:hypothetical protein [Actinosynnema sp. ALI-1.44]|uniref:hypothetical protein n=1 Tax=Actinosynnema sp. ALI-1.44 TaxID=1933779 RepID=UPI0011778F37|nr:hypothetical protein [Actinosynnema sp. ALI-1.44]
MTFTTLFMVLPAGAALAQDNAQAMPATFGGPVGIGVAAVGLTGMVLGFLRFFRKSVKDAKARKTVETPAEATPAAAVVLPAVAAVVGEPEAAPQPARTA